MQLCLFGIHISWILPLKKFKKERNAISDRPELIMAFFASKRTQVIKNKRECIQIW